MAESRSYCAAVELRSFNGFVLSIPTQWPIKIQLAIEPHRSTARYPAACRLLVDGARDQCRCLTLCCTEGNPVQGGVLWGQTAPDAEIRFAGIQVPVLNDGHFYWVWAAICPLLTNW